MTEYTLKVELLSDAVFGSGESVPGVVDQDVLHDCYGFPMMKGKTVKGKLKEEFEQILFCRDKGNTGTGNKITEKLFGKEDTDNSSCLRFSDLTMDRGVRSILAEAVEKKEIDVADVIDATTDIRSFTSINYETGVAKKGSLRKIRVIRKGLLFTGTITSERELTPDEELLLAQSAAALKHLGTMETRGKGFVKCRLSKDGSELTVCAKKDERGKSI